MIMAVVSYAVASILLFLAVVSVVQNRSASKKVATERDEKLDYVMKKFDMAMEESAALREDNRHLKKELKSMGERLDGAFVQIGKLEKEVQLLNIKISTREALLETLGWKKPAGETDRLTRVK